MGPAWYHHKHVQLWATENSGRLDSPHRWGHDRYISCLVDASSVRVVISALANPSSSSKSPEVKAGLAIDTRGISADGKLFKLDSGQV
jgi:hypothetical protein